MPFWQMTTLAPEFWILSTSDLRYCSSSSRNCDSMLGSVIWILASTSVFLTSMAELISATFAPETLRGIPLWTRSLSRIMPSTRELSLMEPPCLFCTLMSSKSTTVSPSTSWATERTALTEMSARNSLTAPALFPVSAVFATSSSISWSTSIECASISSDALSEASLKPSQMTVGCTFCSTKSSLRLSSSPAITTALVVPS